MSSDEWKYQDEWRRNNPPRLKSYPPPDVAIFDYSEGQDCVCVKINSKWVPFLTGVIAVLEEAVYWATDDPEFPLTSIIELQTALHGASDTMNCIDPIEDILFENGVLCIVRNGICTPIAGTETIVTGIGAIGGGWEVEQGGEMNPVSGECGDCEEYPDKPAYDNSGSLRSCSIATNLVEWIMGKFLDSLDKADAAANVVQAADSILLAFAPAYLVWDTISDAVAEWYAVGTSVARALDTIEQREDMKEFLYCELIENNNQMSEQIWTDFKDEFSLIGNSIVLFLGSFKYGAIDNEAHKASYGEDSGCETFPCQVCINTPIDFLASPACGEPRVVGSGQCANTPYGDWDSGSGWGTITCGTGVPTAARYNRLQLFIDLGGVYTVTRIQYTWAGANVEQEQVFTLTPGQQPNGTLRYTGNNAAGSKDSGTINATGVDRVFIILEDVGTVGNPPNETTRYLQSVTITVTV